MTGKVLMFYLQNKIYERYSVNVQDHGAFHGPFFMSMHFAGAESMWRADIGENAFEIDRRNADFLYRFMQDMILLCRLYTIPVYMRRGRWIQRI